MKNKARNIAITCVVVFVIAAVGLSLRSRGPVELESGYQLIMGTFARVVVVAENRKIAEKCIDDAFAAMELVNAQMSDYDENSDISLVNKEGFSRAVPVGQESFEVISRSIQFSEMTDGAFDITVGPLVDLFRNSRETETAPTQEQIDQAKTKVGYEKLVLDGQNRAVQFTIDGMRLDLGGIAKGYGIDKALEATQKAGALGAMVDIGGDMKCFGRTTGNKEEWLIGIQDPNLNNAAGQSLLLKVGVTDNAVATSGNYQQFVIIEGKQYSHIINRSTGTSSEDLSSVTIIADNATDADALATAVSVMGADKGLALIEQLSDVEAILMTSDGQILKSSGADKYIK